MHTTHTPVLPAAAFPFLADLSRQLRGRSHAPDEALAAVALLTATADPDRATTLRPTSGEPAALVERLAVWALRQVDSDTVVLAHALLQGAVGASEEIEVRRGATARGAMAPCGC